ncbi:hypothetical protein [Vulgatibacter sp.]|uniref:hypothetical protein n=1 Tax=Vulgatibacter sp. TaxID=1971226 RepID=UPI003562887C
MVTQPDSIRLFFEALERHDIREAMRWTGEGFSVEAPGHFPLSNKDFCAIQQAVWRAFPDLRYDAEAIRQSLSLGEATVRISGTFLHDLALPWPEIPVIVATGERIALPPERLGFTLEWGEILTVRTESLSAMGLLGVLQPVGVTVPPPGIMG